MLPFGPVLLGRAGAQRTRDYLSDRGNWNVKEATKAHINALELRPAALPLKALKPSTC